MLTPANVWHRHQLSPWILNPGCQAEEPTGFQSSQSGRILSTEGLVTSIFFNTLTDVVMLLSSLMHAVRHPLRHGMKKREGPATRRHPRKRWHLRITRRDFFSPLLCTTLQIKIKYRKYRIYTQPKIKQTPQIIIIIIKKSLNQIYVIVYSILY